MAEKYEVIVVGGGHNGLIAASYLAKAGVNVCVVEYADKVGRGVITEEASIHRDARGEGLMVPY